MVTYCVTRPGTCSPLRCCLDNLPGVEAKKNSLIGLYSPVPQSGKTETAKILLGVGYWSVKFADPIKDMLRGLLRSMGFDHDTVERMVEGDLKEEIIPGFKTVTPRQMMQSLGTDWGREAVQQDIWVKVARAKLDRLNQLGGRVVVDDIRQPNEYAMLRRRGAMLVRVDRPDAEPPAAGDTRYEGLLNGFEFDATIVNDGTLDDLRKQVRHVLLGAVQ